MIKINQMKDYNPTEIVDVYVFKNSTDATVLKQSIGDPTKEGTIINVYKGIEKRFIPYYLRAPESQIMIFKNNKVNSEVNEC